MSSIIRNCGSSFLYVGWLRNLYKFLMKPDLTIHLSLVFYTFLIVLWNKIIMKYLFNHNQLMSLTSILYVSSFIFSLEFFLSCIQISRLAHEAGMKSSRFFCWRHQLFIANSREFPNCIFGKQYTTKRRRYQPLAISLNRSGA